MSKSRSMFSKLILPIILVTIILISFTLWLISYTYTQKFVSNTINSNIEIINQTKTYLEVMHHSLSKVSSSISLNKNLYRLLTNNINTIYDEFLSRYKLSNLFKDIPPSMIDFEMVLVGKNGLCLSSGNGVVPYAPESLLNTSIFKQACNISPKIYYTAQSQGITYSSKNSNSIIGCKALISSTDGIYGAIFIVIKEERLKAFYSNFTGHGTDMILLSADGIILSAPDPSSIAAKNPSLLNAAQRNQKQELPYHYIEGNQIVISKYIPYLDSYVISSMDLNTILKDFYATQKSLIYISLLILLLLLAIIAVIVNRNLAPLKMLSLTMSDSASVIPQQVNISSSTEVNIVSHSYNTMVEKLNHYLKQLEIEYDKRREIELNLLQMQINPHFLYNTLGSIKYLISRNDEEQAYTTIDSLISLLRCTLNKTGTLVLVEEEVKNIKNYINIISPRYDNFITTSLHVSDDCMKYKIPNLILQPFVENAFFHAFQKTPKGKISVFITLNNGNIICEIIDNGDGIEPDVLDALLDEHSIVKTKSVSSIGITNVMERLKMIYSNESSLRIISELGYGTSVIITLPAQIIA
ncbi:MAG TPA: histidine kinase [Clostridia bacterium]|nr:histidine kinase [Clostridia bacterium]